MATNDLSRLIRDTKDADAAIREKAVGDLGDLGQRDPKVIEALISALLDDESDDVRAYAAGSLGLLRDPFGVAPLLNALNDKYWRVRLTAAWALKELGERKAIPELIRLCKDPNTGVRSMAAAKLGEFGSPEALSPLIELLDDPEPDVQWTAINAMFGFADERCLEPLRRLIKAHAGEEYRDSNGNNILGEAERVIRIIEEYRASGV